MNKRARRTLVFAILLGIMAMVLALAGTIIDGVHPWLLLASVLIALVAIGLTAISAGSWTPKQPSK